MKQFIFLFITVLISLIFPAVICAGGMQEDKLAQAEDLIEQKKYNEALILISEVITEEPERFEDAVKLSNRIKAIREKYNKKYEELIIALYDNQDVEKGLVLITELEELDPNPNTQTANTVAQAREGASLVANLNYFEDIMEQGNEFVKKRDFVQAVLTYKKGFTSEPPLDLHKNEYNAADFGTLVEDDLTNTYQKLITFIDSFTNSGNDIIARTDKLLTGISFIGNTDEIPSPVGLLENFYSIAQYKISIKESADFIKSQNDILRERETEGISILYLRYSFQIIMGRDSLGDSEGIIYAINQFLITLSNGIDNTYTKEALVLLEQGKEAYENRDYEQASTLLTRGSDVIKEALPVAYFIDREKILGSDFSIKALGNWDVSDDLPYFMDVQENAKSILAYLYFIETQSDQYSFRELTGVPTENQYVTLENNLRSKKDAILVLYRDWEGYIRDREKNTTIPFNKTNAESILALCAQKVSTLIREEYTYLLAMYNNFTRIYDNEVQLLEQGIKHNQYGAVFYPDKRVLSFNTLNTSLDFVLNNLGTIKDEWQKERNSGDSIGAVIEDIELLYTEVLKLRTRIEDSLKIAENNVLQGNKFRDLGDTRFREAQLALKRKDFIKTESKIKEAGSAYLTSLSFQEDEEIRKKDIQLLSLSRTLEDEKNALAIREYRRLMESGKELYANSLYEEAYDAFIQAQEVWNSTKSEDNPENKDWLAYVLTALTIESARTINETDPLYKEMSQLFNLAKEDYNNALIMQKQGKTGEAKVLFTKAEEKLIIITKQFPYNNDARLLKLYILKETDEKAYNQTFSERINEAKQKVKGTNQDKQEAYIDLKDLAAINPEYPGLKKLITELEYALNIRRRLPTAAEKKESQTLTAQAKPIIIKRDYDNFPTARTLLGKALKLDPDNEEAKNLYDKMGVEAGSEKKIVIAANAMKLFEKAEQLYLKGQFIEAYDIILNLLKDKANRGYEPLKDLEKKLKLALGIAVIKDTHYPVRI